MSNTISSNMNLIIPTVGNESGPTYAFDINASLTLIDQHDHTSGKGVQITPDGLDVNRDLTFNNNSAIDMEGITFISQSSTPGLNTLYEDSTGNLAYIDSLGNNVQITLNGSVFPPIAGNIVGLTAPAAASYSALTRTFTWQSNSSTPLAANMDFGAAVLRNTSPNSTFGLTLQPPTLSSNYTLTLPAIPGSTKFLTIDTSGIISTVSSVQGTQIAALSLTGSQLANQTITATQIANTTITAVQIANTTITGTKIAAATIAITNMGVGNFITSSSSGTFATAAGAGVVAVPNLSATLTCVANRLVKIYLVSDNTNPAQVGPNTGALNGNLYIFRGASQIGVYNIQSGFNTPGAYLDFGPPAGANTYSIKAEALSSGNFLVNYVQLVVMQD